MKALKPSHREHKRYLLLKGKDTNKKSIEESILKFIGILGYSKACPQIISISKTKKSMILCINRTELDKIKSSLLLSGKDIQIEKISGVVNNVK